MNWSNVKYGILGILIALLVIIFGCQALRPIGEPELGKYDYTHRPVYTGVPKRVIPIWIDKNFGLGDLESIESAVKSWNFVLNGYVVLEIKDTDFDMEVPKIVEQTKAHGWLFLRIEHDSPIIPKQDEPGYWTIGFADRIGGNHMYLIRDRLGDADIYGVTMHEIGHLLGADHVGQRLMYPHYSKARFQCVDWESLMAVAHYLDIPVGDLNFCVDGDNKVGMLEAPKSGPIY